MGDVLWRWRWVGLGIVASKKGAALLEGMVHAGSTCLRRVADGERRSEVRFNRFLANPKVTVERLVAGWSEATGAAVVGRHVLAIQDTSEINFRTTRTRTRGLGEIGKGVGRGALLHAMVAVDGESEACLGLVAGAVWTRCGRVGVPHGKRPLDQKESHRWIKTATAGKGVLEGAATVTMVADREADLYALWALVPEPGIHVLGRIHHDRSVVGGGSLTTIARQWPVAGTRRMMLRERPGRPEREARLELRFGVVTIARPRDAGAPGLPAQVRLSLIELSEPDPPPGAEPITCSPPILPPMPLPPGRSSAGTGRDGSSNSCFGCSKNKDCASKTAKSRPPNDCLNSSPLPLMPRCSPCSCFRPGTGAAVSRLLLPLRPMNSAPSMRCTPNTAAGHRGSKTLIRSAASPGQPG